MPHRLSLVHRLAELRRAYTGETDSTLSPAIVCGVQRLDSDDRALLHRVLNHNYMARLFGHDEMPPPPRRVRQALLPDTTDAAQQELESAVLTAAGKAVNYLHLRRPSDVGQPARVFRMVRPGEDEMVLHLHGGVLGPLLAELMPREADGVVTGVAGLRIAVSRRHVDLHLVDQPQATIKVSNVSWRQWTAALAFVNRMVGSLGGLAWLGNDPCPLNDAEQFTVAAGRRTPGPTALNSALLRRAGLFRDVRWWRVRPRAGATTTIEWAAESASLSLGKAARLLLHPLFGIPGDCPRPHYFDHDYLSLTIPDEGSGAAELLLRPRVTGREAGDSFDELYWRDASDAWSDFDRVLSAPNPTHAMPLAAAPKPGPNHHNAG